MIKYVHCICHDWKPLFLSKYVNPMLPSRLVQALWFINAAQTTVRSDQISSSVVSDTLWPHGLQYIRLTYPAPYPEACSNSCPLSQWCHPAISSSVVLFSSHLQSFPASGSFPMSQLFAWCGQSTGVPASASFPPKKSQSWLQDDFLSHVLTFNT